MKERRNLNMKSTSEILVRISKSSSENKENGIFTKLYRYLLREDSYYLAYKKLYANNGAGTKGIDNDTADGFSQEYVSKLIEELKNLTYSPKAVRRIEIPKQNGKLRPLGIPSFKDKLVQEVIRQILEAIYEPIFSEKSHGFRPNKSCHSALKQISFEFRSVKWFVEGDIMGCFDNIQHQKLLDILSKKIKDSKLINLIGKFLKAGYMKDFKYYGTYSGTPQGGILSPILANIYLSELDNKVAEIKKQFDRKPTRSYSKAYCEQNAKIKLADRELQVINDNSKRDERLKEIHQLKVERSKLPYKDDSDKKLSYVRYADDFLIGISGTKQEAEEIKTELKVFLLEQLGLELSEEKTKITHSSENARFLGYDVSIRRNQQTKRNKKGVVQRHLNNSVELLVPLKDKIEKFLFDKKIVIQGNYGEIIPFQKVGLTTLTDLEILQTYNSQTRGICNYYAMACNFGKLIYFTYLMEYSCLKTLASKHKTRISHIKKMFKLNKSWGVPYETKQGRKVMKIATFLDMKNAKMSPYSIDKIKETAMHFGSVNSLEARLKASKCELCGDEKSKVFEIHHINKVKNLKGKTLWERAMIAKKRKTLVVCKACHCQIHNKKLNEK